VFPEQRVFADFDAKLTQRLRMGVQTALIHIQTVYLCENVPATRRANAHPGCSQKKLTQETHQ